MKVLISPDKFKGSLSADEVCASIKRGLENKNKSFEIISHPLADGGDGSLYLIEKYIQTVHIDIKCLDPLSRQINSYYLMSDNKAFIELASASGHVLLSKEDQNPMNTSTRGTGQMIVDAISKGANQIYLFLGGSATNDAGLGILCELGLRFLNADSQELLPVGKSLNYIHHIDTKNLISNNKFTLFLICDVDNPLYGENGAAMIYAKQKGASESEILWLDDGLKNFAAVCKKQTNIDIHNIKGAGAAGGIAGGLSAFINCEIQQGSKTLMELSGYYSKLQSADVIISGEGCLDHQSLNGKVTHAVYLLAKKHNKKIIFVVGTNTLNDHSDIPGAIVFTILEHAKDNEDAIRNASKYLELIGEQLSVYLESLEIAG